MDEKYKAPADIERRSMELIQKILTEELHTELPEDRAPVIKRVIHTTADFDYVRNLEFSDDAMQSAFDAIGKGATIVCDTNMARSGINSKALARHGCRAVCFMAEPDVASEAIARGVTRAAVSMERAARLYGTESPLIYAIGNAPTALIRLRSLIEEGLTAPALVIGVPVGFVNVIESKESIKEAGVPYIVAAGRKGGSTVAAAVCNSLLYMMDERQGMSR